MNSVTIPCKLCKKPVQLEVDQTCPPEWLDMLAPAVTCTRCYGLAQAKTKAFDQIREAVALLDPIRLRNHKRESEIRQHARDVLANATKDFSATLAEFYGHPELSVWTPTIVDEFASNPEDWFATFQKFRKDIRAKIKLHEKNLHSHYEV